MTVPHSLPITLTIDRGVSLVGTIRLESPFRAWKCLLQRFEGGAFSYVSPNCQLLRVTLGRYCSIGNDVEVLSQHPTFGLTTSPFPYQTLFTAPFDTAPYQSYESLGDTRIGHDVWIGAGVRIRTGVTIGNGAIVGAGSVVTKDVPSFAVVGGTPAKLIRMRFPEQIVEHIERLAWWEYNLLGLKVPTEDPETALDAIEAAVDSGQLQPYRPGFCAVWREGQEIKARRDTQKAPNLDY